MKIKKHQQKRIFMAQQIKYYQALCKSACDSIINVDFSGSGWNESREEKERGRESE